jgi:hypothetical protein
MDQIVGRMPRYDCGTGTTVVMAFRFDDVAGGECAGDVHVAICARRSTVSSGNLMDRSNAEPKKVAILQLAGFMAGSSPRYDFSITGVLVEINVGSVEVKKVIGNR